MWLKRNRRFVIVILLMLVVFLDAFIFNAPIYFFIVEIALAALLLFDISYYNQNQPSTPHSEEVSSTENIIQAIDLPICIINKDNILLYENTMFTRMFRIKDTIDDDVVNYFNIITNNFTNAPRFLFINFRTYRVVASTIRDGSYVITFTDISEYMEGQNMQKRFIADASHELKTPLTSMKLTLDLLNTQDNLPKETQQEFLDILEKQTNRLMLLVNDLLTMSRLAHSRIPLRFQYFSIHQLLQEIVDNHQVRIDTIGLNIILPSEDIMIFSDQQKLSQILNNLFVNALNYTTFGHIRFSSEIVGDQVKIRVADSGTGISANDLNFIFERFYRSDSARSRDVGGTGLGLSIIKELTEALGGTIQVKSELNAGTVFTVTLPLENLTEN